MVLIFVAFGIQKFFATTWSFFFTTPNAVKWSFSTDPIAWNRTGEFLFVPSGRCSFMKAAI